MSINVQVSPIPNINISVGNSGNLLNLSPQGYTLHANTHISGGIDAIDHNYLLGLQGGQNNEYYHLSSTEYNNSVFYNDQKHISGAQFIFFDENEITGGFINSTEWKAKDNGWIDINYQSAKGLYIDNETVALYTNFYGNSWVFNDNGSLTFPDGSIQTKAFDGNFTGENKFSGLAIFSNEYPIPYNIDNINPSIVIDDAAGFQYYMIYSGGTNSYFKFGPYSLNFLHQLAYNANQSVNTALADIEELTNNSYSISNPSGFITGINNIVYDFGNQNISGIKNFYLRPTVNGTGILLSGDITSQPEATGVSGYLQGQITILNNQTGSYTLHSETGVFYPLSNPSGFITNINLSPYATIEYVTGVSGLLQNEINTLYNQTGDYVLKSNTGQFLTTGAADNRYVDLNNNQTIYGNKTFSNDVYINHLFVTGTETIANSTVSNIQSPYILLNLTGGAFDGGIFFITGSGLTGVNDSGAIIGFDHSDKFKFGISTRASDLSTLDTIASFEEMTGISGTLQTQISTLTNQTGGYVLKIETGQFYASSNPSGFITGVDLSSYVLNTETGQFYTSSNPSGFITGIDNLIYTTGDQSISGNINISGNLTISGVYNIYQQIENAKILAIAYAIAL
jgi:hypothetical protein